jgi:hypothetical protein
MQRLRHTRDIASIRRGGANPNGSAVSSST